MESLRIKSGSGIKEIAVENQKGEVVSVLRIDVDNGDIVTSFSRLIWNLEHMPEEFKENVEELKEKYGDRPEDEKASFEEIVDISRMNVSLLKRCAEEIDKVFGVDTVRNVFKESYDLNENFVPDEDALLDFIEEVIPVMEKLFEHKFARNRKRYNPANRGKKTRR